MRAIMLASVACSACSSDKGPGTPSGETGLDLIELTSVGTACVYGDGAPSTATSTAETAFEIGAVITVVVTLDPCASGCAGDLSASCTARLVGTELAVDATASYTIPSGSPSCDDVCIPIVATCEGDPFDAGYFVLDYGGGHSDGFVVPGPSLVPCADSLRVR